MRHDDVSLDALSKQLKVALPPWDDLELKSDLWPRMLRRLEERPEQRFGWFESVLVGLVVLAFAVFPELVPLVLYHL